jgi:ureidoglycolate hydrolase
MHNFQNTYGRLHPVFIKFMKELEEGNPTALLIKNLLTQDKKQINVGTDILSTLTKINSSTGCCAEPNTIQSLEIHNTSSQSSVPTHNMITVIDQGNMEK